MTTKDEALKRIMEAHKFNVATLRPREVHAIAYEALAEQDSEPVAGECRFEGETEWRRCSVAHHLHVQAHPEEWPGYETRALYTTPQPAPAVQPLTDEQIYECERIAAIRYQRHKNSIRGQQITPADNLQWHFARAIEAAHGIGAPKGDV